MVGFPMMPSVKWKAYEWVGTSKQERKTPDELVRELHEAVKPKLYA